MCKSIKITLIAILTLQLFICVCYGAEQNYNSDWKSLYKAKKNDEWFAKDKVKHFTVSMLLATIAYSAVNAGKNEESSSIIAGASFSIGLGLLKEFKDLKDGKFWSNKDLIWDVVGAGVAVSIVSQFD